MDVIQMITMISNKRVFLNIILSILFCFSVPMLQAQEDKYKNVVITTQKVSDGIYMLMGEGGNIGVSVGEDGVFMIDDQFAPLTEKIKAAIAEISDKPIRFLINTHWHFDHTGGNENLGKDGVLIVAHDNVYERMSVDTTIGAFNMTVPASPKVALPVITFNDSMTFRLNNEEMHVLHRKNAHTDGDSIIFFNNSNVLHTGDVWFNGLYPFIDTSVEGSIDGIIEAVKYILTKIDDETKIIPGHGPLANKNDLKAYLKFLSTYRDRMQKLIDEGKSLEEIIALKPNADYDAKLGKGFLTPEQFASIVHDSLTR